MTNLLGAEHADVHRHPSARVAHLPVGLAPDKLIQEPPGCLRGVLVGHAKEADLAARSADGRADERLAALEPRRPR